LFIPFGQLSPRGTNDKAAKTLNKSKNKQFLSEPTFKSEADSQL